MGRTAIKDSELFFEDNFKRAVSPMLTLLILSEKPVYVYKLSQELERRSNSSYKIGFLYPVLYRLQQQGYVEEYSQEQSESHRTRNYYAITDSGRKHLESLKKKYAELLLTVDAVLDSSSEVQAVMPTEEGF